MFSSLVPPHISSLPYRLIPPLLKEAVAYIRLSVVRFSRQESASFPGNTKFYCRQLKWHRRVHLRVLPSPLSTIIPPMFHIHLSSLELKLGSLVAANQQRLSITSSYDNTDEVAGQLAS